VNDVGKPCAGEPHARFERGPLGRLTHVAGTAGLGPVAGKPPPWPGRDLNCNSRLLNQWPTSLHMLGLVRWGRKHPDFKENWSGGVGFVRWGRNGLWDEMWEI
jgi:hypothetical protein